MTQNENQQASITTFQELNLHPTILSALEKLNFSVPTPIQGMSLPSSLAGKDVQGEASTGTGKTLAFLLALFQSAATDRSFQSLILVPTRELVTQVGDVIEAFRRIGLNINWIGLNGGTSIVPQLRRLRSPMQIYVGTPGRIYDHLGRGSLQLDNLQTFVLDEADRMLDMGFAPQIKKIQSFFPEDKPQTLFFSATYPVGVKKLVASLLDKPVFVKAVSKDIQKPDIDQDAFHMDGKDKFSALVKQLAQRQGSVLVFSQTQRSTEKLAQRLQDEGVDVARIHGGLNQGQRNRTLRDFRDCRTRVLIATDVAARGLDVDHVNHVINYDVPQQAEDYIHRIGRTGRAGRKGEAISFVTNDDRQVWREIRAIVKKELEVELPEFFAAAKRNEYNKPSSASASAGRPRQGSGFGGERSGGARPSRFGTEGSRSDSRPSRYGANNSSEGPRSDARPSRFASDGPRSDSRPYRSDARPARGGDRPARTDGPRSFFGNDSRPQRDSRPQSRPQWTDRPARAGAGGESRTDSRNSSRPESRAPRARSGAGPVRFESGIKPKFEASKFRSDAPKSRSSAEGESSFKPKKKYGPSNTKKSFSRGGESKPEGFVFKAKRPDSF